MEPLFGLLFSLHRGTPQYGDWVVACLQGAWPKLLGERLAAACRPARFNGSKLVVEILDGAWADALKSVEPELLEKLRTATAGEVKAIAVVGR